MRGCAMGSRSRRARNAERVAAMLGRALALGLKAVPTTDGRGVWVIHPVDRWEPLAPAGNLRACERWLDGYAAATPYGPPLGNRQASVDSSASP